MSHFPSATQLTLCGAFKVYVGSQDNPGRKKVILWKYFGENEKENSEAYLILYDQMGDKRLVYGEISNKFKNGKEEMKHKEQGIYVGLMGPESVDLPRGKNLIPFHQSRPPHLKLSLSGNFIFFYFQHLSSLLLWPVLLLGPSFFSVKAMISMRWNDLLHCHRADQEAQSAGC